jgi:hypothetical protein
MTTRSLLMNDNSKDVGGEVASKVIRRIAKLFDEQKSDQDEQGLK